MSEPTQGQEAHETLRRKRGVVGFLANLSKGAAALDGVNAQPHNPSVSVVIPALNEERSIGWVLDNLPAWVGEVVLVDGLSIDRTEVVVSDRRPDVVLVHQRSRGKGAALRAGFAAATGDIIVMIDADGSTDPREMGLFVDALRAGADFAKGSRNLPGGGSADFTRLRHLGNLGFVKSANLLFGAQFTDLCYGYCAFWRRQLDSLALTADGFEIEMQMVLGAVKAGLAIVEVPSLELERRAGSSNLSAWSDGWRVLGTLLRERMRRLDPARGHAARIVLRSAAVAAPSSDRWVPAGTDRRRYLPERRGEDPIGAGSRRRPGDRRAQLTHTAPVLIVRDSTEIVPHRARTPAVERMPQPASATLAVDWMPASEQPA